jgi:hypothetical protein
MKKLLFASLGAVFLASCTVTIPLQTNLSEQTLLLAENRNIKVNYTLESEVADGYINYINVLKNGTETTYDATHKYASATAFSKVWESYFSSKFNAYSKEEMKVDVVLKSLHLRQNNTTSIGMTALTGTSQMNVEAIGEFYVKVEFRGEVYEKDIAVNVSEYNDIRTGNIGGIAYSSNAVNPTQQKSKLLESCLNRSVLEFENFLKSIMQNQ